MLSPPINVLGTVDLLLVETTPVVIAGELWRFESVRPEYYNNTHSTGATSGHSYFRFVHVMSGRTSSPFAHGHALGCAMFDEVTGAVYVYGTIASSSGGGGAVNVFWSIDGLQTWQSKQAIDFASRGEKVYNTAVDRGQLAGDAVYVMAYERALSGTPGMWNTAFATAPTAAGPWTVLDASTYSMGTSVEHADPALRFVEEDGFWYSITARRDPAGSWYFVSPRSTAQRTCTHGRPLRAWARRLPSAHPSSSQTPRPTVKLHRPGGSRRHRQPSWKSFGRSGRWQKMSTHRTSTCVSTRTRRSCTSMWASSTTTTPSPSL
mmetsp:Transcript_24489/g.71796  ORF Transcript_24489/g.71796 Transcript_24489/m.71796 type:complete len:320 (-) Transcript_24489:200-1159(-)